MLNRIFYKIFPTALIYFCMMDAIYSQSLQTPFEKNNETTTTYHECVAFYKKLEQSTEYLKVIEAGSSDVAYPIHTVIISNKKTFSAEESRKSGKLIVLINNGIHPGEPDGIDAGMIFARDLITDKNKQSLLEHVTIVIIPIYNVSGSLTRNKFTRVNQNGPIEYGFRANAQNLDLNRDFIKCDSRNAETFNKIFNSWDPDVFLDTHCTDGADYPYIMTLIASQRQKMQKHLGDFVHDEFLPAFYQKMKSDGLESFPYINADEDPVNGIYDYMDYPRISSGYANLFHSIAIISESHMLKPHAARVLAQKQLMHNLINISIEYKEKIISTRIRARNNYKFQHETPIRWKLNTAVHDSIPYKAYKTERSVSPVTGKERIKYYPGVTFETKIPYYHTSNIELKIKTPDTYIIPAAFHAVTDRLKWNGVKMIPIQNDTLIEVELYRILNYKSSITPYENHYVHSQIELEKIKMQKQYFKGDLIIPVKQDAMRYIIETLEPEAHDSFFAWNFFDGILQRKEYFSDYLFEDLAWQYLQQDEKLRQSFEKKKKTEPDFAEDKNAMLHYIYINSKHSEPGYMVYPVGRIL